MIKMNQKTLQKIQIYYTNILKKYKLHICGDGGKNGFRKSIAIL